jgi:hypothetical protein
MIDKPVNIGDKVVYTGVVSSGKTPDSNQEGVIQSIGFSNGLAVFTVALTDGTVFVSKFSDWRMLEDHKSSRNKLVIAVLSIAAVAGAYYWMKIGGKI